MADKPKLQKVMAIVPFDLAGKSYLPGEVEVPADKIEKLREKKLIASEDVTQGVTLTGTPLETELVSVLAQHVGEAGNSEGALDTLKRIVDERDTSKQELESSLKTNQDLIETNNDLQKQFKDAQTELVPLRSGIEAVAGELPPLAGLERGESEAPLDYLRRYGAHFQTVILNSHEEIKTDGQAQAQTQGQVTGATVGTPVTAEELTKVVGAKAALSLVKAEFDTREKIGAASDKELEALTDVGEGSRKKLRDWLAA